MKRLTYTSPIGGYGFHRDIDDVIIRLAEIEDILGDEYDLDNLCEALEKQVEYEQFIERWKQTVQLAGFINQVGAEKLSNMVEADKEGKCLLLPLKPGDEVYYIGWSVCSQGWDDPEECSGCGYDECDSKRVVESMKIHSYSWIVENFIERENHYYYKTYEEAEAVLEGENNYG